MSTISLDKVMSTREHKYDEHIKAMQTQYWTGYEEGWRCAYRDLREILEQNGFDMTQTVIKNNN